MPMREGGLLGLWYFDTVQEFWEAEGLEGDMTWVERNNFYVWLAKGMAVNGVPRVATIGDRQQRLKYNIIFVKQLRNDNRHDNWVYSNTPPPRTGKFDEFMDEIEAVARRFGIQYIYIESVANTFLPSKFETRGYRRMNNPGNPYFVKTIT